MQSESETIVFKNRIIHGDYRAAPIPIRDKPKMLPDRY